MSTYKEELYKLNKYYEDGAVEKKDLNNEELNESIKLYNKGLENIKEGNVTKGVEFLNKSIELNPGNYVYRNLLGLCYLEHGELSKAIIQWKLSKDIKKERNLANKYIKIVSSNITKVNRMNRSIKEYNEGLMLVRKGEYSKGVMHLESSVILNVKLLKAHNLLALTYLNMEKYSKALDRVARVLEMENKNKNALEYLKEIESKIGKENKGVEVEVLRREYYNNGKVSKFNNDKKVIKEKKVITYIFIIVFFLGVVVGYGATMLKPRNEDLEKVQTLQNNLLKMSELNKKIILYNNEEKKTLQEKLESLRIDKKDNIKNIEKKSNTIVMLKAEILKEKGDYKGAARLLNVIENGEVEEKERFESLKKEVYNAVANELYLEGETFYRAKDYINAVSSLELGFKYSGSGHEKLEHILYLLGKSYIELGEKTKAKGYFELIIRTLPEGWFSKKAKIEIEKLGV